MATRPGRHRIGDRYLHHVGDLPLTGDQITDAVSRLDTAIRYTELAMITGAPDPAIKLAEIAQANALIAVAERLDTLIGVLKGE